jgi:hypothetical protein
MPFPYKYTLGAVDIGIKRFSGILREARTMPYSIFFDDAVP